MKNKIITLSLLIVAILISVFIKIHITPQESVPTKIIQKEESLIFTKEEIQNHMQNKYTKPSDQELKTKLTDLQYKVTQQEGTEPSFRNEYWNNHEPGIYVDIVTGQPLFSSVDKYDSRTGWPSFVKPIDQNLIETKVDRSLDDFPRTEVHSKLAHTHLGHVFNDGPEDRGGLRYCMNSASLKFISKDDMEKLGYGKYLNVINQ
jgi:methionine-R-sulfoxide reductase